MITPKIFIVEDEALPSDHLTHILKQQGYEVVGAVMSGEEAVNQIPLTRPDLLLLDIDLKKGGGQLDGIEVAAHLHQHYPVPVIFLTSYEDASILRRIRTPFEGFLNKPATEAALIAAVEQALSRQICPIAQETSAPDYLLLAKGKRYEKVPLAEILYVEAANVNLTVQTADGQQYVAGIPLRQFEQQFSGRDFMRIGRSHMINIHQVTGFEDPATVILGAYSLQIGKTYRKTVKQALPFLRM